MLELDGEYGMPRIEDNHEAIDRLNRYITGDERVSVVTMPLAQALAAPALAEACKLFVQAERQAVGLLNDAGIPGPADLGLAAEKARAALALAEPKR